MFITRLGPKGSRIILILCLLAPLSSRAEVRQVGQFSFTQKQASWTLGDLYGRFGQQAMALTAQGDLLVFSPRRTGAWELFRIQRWDTGKPAINHLQLADYFSSHDQHDLGLCCINLRGRNLARCFCTSNRDGEDGEQLIYEANLIFDARLTGGSYA
jgi:hypothetical protein